MCSYDGELFNLDFSVHVLFPSYRDSDLYLPLYDWQTRTVWPKNIKIGSTEEKKTPTSWMPLGLSGFCCVSSVPASCVHIWFVSCPCFMSLWVKYVPAVFVSLCVNYPVYLVPVFWVWFRLVYLWLPGVSVHVSHALMSPLKTIIWVYVLVCVFLFPPRVCTVTEDQTQTVSGAHSPRFVFIFKSLLFCSCSVCSVARKSPLVIPP